MCRAIAACRTPVVSAIGHEPDNPLSDYVADLRAATPTDAAKHVVPDAAAEQTRVIELRARSAAALRGWVERETATLAHVRSRPVLAEPMRRIDERNDEIAQLRAAARRDIRRATETEATRVVHLSERVAALGPAATLARGYAVVQRVAGPADMAVVRSVTDAPPGSQLRIRVGDGALRAATLGNDTFGSDKLERDNS